MNRFRFYGFEDYENGKMAHLETCGEYEIPVNVFVDNAADLDGMCEGLCSVDLSGIGSGIEIYESEKEYLESGADMDSVSMIPVGTFPLDEDDEEYEESPHILFSGKVLEAEENTDAGEDEPNYCLLVETLGFDFKLLIRYDGVIGKGCIVHGIAWLFGDMFKD